MKRSWLNGAVPVLCVMLATCEANAAAEEVWLLGGFSVP
jgi:hypothetical protein